MNIFTKLHSEDQKALMLFLAQTPCIADAQDGTAIQRGKISQVKMMTDTDEPFLLYVINDCHFNPTEIEPLMGD